MKIHKDCIPLDKKEYNDVLSKDDSWICKFCISYAFQYCWIGDGIVYEDAIIEFCDGIPDINGKFKDKVFYTIRIKWIWKTSPTIWCWSRFAFLQSYS